MISEGVVESTEGLDRLPTPVPVANPRIRPSRSTLKGLIRPSRLIWEGLIRIYMTFKVNFITHLPCLQMQLLVCLQNVSSRPPSSRTTSRPTGVQVTSGEITQQARDFTGDFIAAIIVTVLVVTTILNVIFISIVNRKPNVPRGAVHWHLWEARLSLFLVP